MSLRKHETNKCGFLFGHLQKRYSSYLFDLHIVFIYKNWSSNTAWIPYLRILPKMFLYSTKNYNTRNENITQSSNIHLVGTKRKKNLHNYFNNKIDVINIICSINYLFLSIATRIYFKLISLWRTNIII